MIGEWWVDGWATIFRKRLVSDDNDGCWWLINENYTELHWLQSGRITVAKRSQQWQRGQFQKHQLAAGWTGDASVFSDEMAMPRVAVSQKESYSKIPGYLYEI